MPKISLLVILKLYRGYAFVLFFFIIYISYIYRNLSIENLKNKYYFFIIHNFIMDYKKKPC